MVGDDEACPVSGRQPLRSPRGDQRGVLVFSCSAVVVLAIAEEPSIHELFFQGQVGACWASLACGARGQYRGSDALVVPPAA